MRTTIDRAGRLVVPKQIRDRLGLVAGTGVEISERDGEVVLRPLGPAIRLEERRGRKVFVTDGPDAALTDDDVRALIDESRQWPRA
ncbi:MAG TPA: AbrB/MazE/SpoVT family DNA-binding domain-containing protein [Actinomycetales bacterium]|nr:AbrB/MazE/SpoVT family DNA-binding domain-containing protein [Actinomycetales bacterium]